MSSYPIVYGWRDPVQGDGFMAGVAVDGRALVHEEEDGYVWVEGVTPGGIAGTGRNSAEALAGFRRSYQGVLYDIAAESKTFTEFERGVHAFFENCGQNVLRAWEESVARVREDRVETREWTKVRVADSELKIVVEQIRDPAARNNELEEGPALAVAG